MSYEYQRREVTERPGKAFRPGEGRISGYLSLFLGGLSFITVMAYLYPAYLTTTELRATYDAHTLQIILKYGMWFSLFFGVATFVSNKKKTMGFFGITLTLTAFALGGYTVPIGAVPEQELSLGVDWLVLAFLGSAVIFTALEKLFPKYKNQVILREEWELDFFYFCINHLMISAVILSGNFVVSHFQWAMNADLQQTVQALPLLIQVLLLIIVADFVLYWEHRMFHEVGKLWPFHAVHHSVETLDWLAGSRSHFVQTFFERSVVMLALYMIGAEKIALDAYVAYAALQAIVIHCNLDIPFGPLRHLLVTPQYHHWHHSSETPAIDTNYAAHTTLFDRMFGTYHMPDRHWPAHYGTLKRLPRTFWGQIWFPFKSLLAHKEQD